MFINLSYKCYNFLEMQCMCEIKLCFQNVTVLFAVLELNVLLVTMGQLVSASKVSWAILSLVVSAFRIFALLKFHAPSQAYVSADVANDAAKE